MAEDDASWPASSVHHNLNEKNLQCWIGMLCVSLSLSRSGLCWRERRRCCQRMKSWLICLCDGDEWSSCFLESILIDKSLSSNIGWSSVGSIENKLSIGLIVSQSLVFLETWSTAQAFSQGLIIRWGRRLKSWSVSSWFSVVKDVEELRIWTRIPSGRIRVADLVEVLYSDYSFAAEKRAVVG